MMKIIGICGGSGSGKTTLVEAVREHLPLISCVLSHKIPTTKTMRRLRLKNAVSSITTTLMLSIMIYLFHI